MFAGFFELRVIRLEVFDFVGFDCNIVDVDYLVDMINLIVLIFSNSLNIDFF